MGEFAPLSTPDKAETPSLGQVWQNGTPPDAVGHEVAVGHGQRSVASAAMGHVLQNDATDDLMRASGHRPECRAFHHCATEPDPGLALWWLVCLAELAVREPAR